MATTLPAVIPQLSEHAPNVVRIFGANAQVTGGQQPARTVWRDHYDLKNAHIAGRRLVNGYKQTGDTELFHIAAWENPSRPGQFSVGMMWESYAYGQQVRGVPQSIELRLHSNFDSFEDAVRAADSLARNNTYSTLKKLIEEGDATYTRLSTDPTDVPFLRPDAWKGSSPFSATRLVVK